jgi:release factor glutamine methyltransferase
LTTVAELLRDAAERLRAAGIDSARADARILLAHVLGVEPSSIFSLSPTFVGEREVLFLFESLLVRRIAREPVAYITGTKEFWSLDFAVGPGALIPRPETETLVEQVLKHFPSHAAPLDVLDLGTGTGCLLVAVLSEYANARGVGLDSSAQALGWARRNVEKHGSNAQLFEGDFAAATGFYDVILANPPYIRTEDIALLAPEVRLYEPAQALDGGADGLDAYRVLAPEIERLLKPGGTAFMEIGAGQGPAVGKLMKTVEIVPDLAGIERCAIGRKS